MIYLALVVAVILGALYFATDVDRQLLVTVAATCTVLVVGHGFVDAASGGTNYAWTQSKLETRLGPTTVLHDAMERLVLGEFGYPTGESTGVEQSGLHFDGEQYSLSEAAKVIEMEQIPPGVNIAGTVPSEDPPQTAAPSVVPPQAAAPSVVPPQAAAPSEDPPQDAGIGGGAPIGTVPSVVPPQDTGGGVPIGTVPSEDPPQDTGIGGGAPQAAAPSEDPPQDAGIGGGAVDATGVATLTTPKVKTFRKRLNNKTPEDLLKEATRRDIITADERDELMSGVTSGDPDARSELIERIIKFDMAQIPENEKKIEEYWEKVKDDNVDVPLDMMMEIASECRRIRDMVLTPGPQRTIIRSIYTQWAISGRRQVNKLRNQALDASPDKREQNKESISKIGAIDKIFGEQNLAGQVDKALDTISQAPNTVCRQGVESAARFIDDLLSQTDSETIATWVVSIMVELKLFLDERRLNSDEDFGNLREYCWSALRDLVEALSQYLQTLTGEIRALLENYDEYMETLQSLNTLVQESIQTKGGNSLILDTGGS